MDALHLSLAAIILCLSSAAQSAVGFGYALFATPLLVCLGVPLPTAMIIVASCSLFQASTGAYKLREHIPWKIVFKGCAIRSIATMLGVTLMFVLIGMSQPTLQLYLGIILCVLLLIRIVARPKPREHVAAGWGWASFSLSGLLAGTCGMGSSPIVIWMMAHDWDTKRIRGLMFAIYTVCIPLQLILLTATIGKHAMHDFLIGLCCLPLAFIGAQIGHPIGNKISRKRLSQFAYLLLFSIGVGSIIPSLHL
ncbi:sulfite exporter TauE/SafE family protein [Persicirhabdus sediminis]|uniref:Probable membrane transporter protein n=1 Tax=Persicirhabdus sediminis TaxID=454144 RepID=A0A8J7SJV9_9BACT|nr:sulfite exporter TauE/SafE family protein [Persicirhabdus sediminis]MBK1792420.1 sulfite exporter TauE/SafE family protein [Persicirhabdus sediminis]